AAEQVRETANQLLEAQLAAEQAGNQLQALTDIGRGLTQTADEIAAEQERQAKAFENAANQAQKLTGAQRRLAEAGRILRETSAQEERFAREQEALERLQKQQEE